MAYENGRRILGYFRKCQHKRLLKRSFVRKNCRGGCGRHEPEPDWCCMRYHPLHRRAYLNEPCRYWTRTHPGGWKTVKDHQKYTNKRIRQLPVDAAISSPSEYRRIRKRRGI